MPPDEIRPASSKSDITLRTLAEQHSNATVEQEHGCENEASDHSPADRGLRAYLFLVAACFIEGLMWGFPLTFGVFLPHYQADPAFASGIAYLPVIGTLATGVPFLFAPLITPLTTRYLHHQQALITSGWLMCILSLLLASLSTQTWHLILTQGLLYGLGFLLLYYALLDMLNTWFVERRGWAYGVLFAAAGVSGGSLPFILNSALKGFGWRIVLRGCACVIGVMIGPLLPLCRRRRTSDTLSSSVRTMSMAKPSTLTTNTSVSGILRSKTFVVLSAGNMLQSIAAYLPGIYLPLFLVHIGASQRMATTALCTLNLSQVIGQLATGWLSDRLPISHLATLSPTISAAAVLGLWLPARSVGLTITFAVVFGLVAGGYTVLYPRVIGRFTKDPVVTMKLYGVLACQRGIGIVLAGPISSQLTRRGFPIVSSDQGAEFRAIMVFTGVALALSSVGGMVMRVKPNEG